ncbi:aldo/keto reductase [Bosea psychrotolerans]|uniref:Aryl-alcohol dehydrogenase-like predicted oxidoreductase n=1 Tax=Bosea psychrotolerans TaxID=1871628 RepID=A0A2S4LV42_9HYPH|nr:aldo/keto reductase [Bosea psychrotolerans]POR46219.1 aryl-alcohol dehydrogenase-like predicted oxidoreductase [Bosea psychrotolerans]
MLTRNLGRSGLRVSLVGLGCNNFGGRIDDEAARKVVDAAIEHGITLFDTADVYGARGGSETVLGQLLGPRRKDIVLASKFGMDMNDAGTMKGGSRRYIMSAVEASLQRLKTDWLDLYQFHRADPLTPIDETLRALEDMIRQGKVRYIGCSNMPAWQMANAEWTARDLGINGFASCQDEYSLLVRGAEKDLIPAARHFGMGLLPYFPLANGLLTGKYKRNAPMPEGARMTREAQRANEVLTDVNWERTEKLTAFCEARGKTLVELAFSWLAAQPVVSSVIAGATKPEQIAANVKAAEWALTAEELAEIDAITK